MPDDFPYELTAHAAKVITERGIRLEWVARVLEQPTRIESDSVDPTLLHALARIPEYGERVLRVVFVERTEPWLVVTAYFDRRKRGGL